jgi:hypothetical protein
MTGTKQGIGIGARQLAADVQLLYSLDNDGVLSSYRHDKLSGDVAGPLRVASGPDFKQVFSGGDGVIYAIRDNGELLWYRHDARTGDVEGPNSVGTG